MKFKILVMVLLISILSGCYWNADVERHQVGVVLSRNEIKGCVGSGVYSDMGWFSELITVNRGTVTFSVEDPEVATKDTQTVGVRVTIQARRLDDCDSIKNLLTNWPSLINDQAFVDTITATAREGMKVGVRSQTLTQLLDDRNTLADTIRGALEADVQKYNAMIVNVTIENIAPSAEWTAIQQQKANLQAETEREKQRQEFIKQQGANSQLEQEQNTLVLEKQLLAEQAKTSVEVEIAKREGEKTAAAQQVYTDNPQAFTLKYMELLAKVFGDKSTIWMLDKDVPLNSLFDPNGQPQTIIPVIPVTPTPNP